jgi:hypothetical protein
MEAEVAEEKEELGSTQTWGFWFRSAAATLLRRYIRCFFHLLVMVKSIDLLLWFKILHTRCMSRVVAFYIALFLFILFLDSTPVVFYFFWPSTCGSTQIIVVLFW